MSLATLSYKYQIVIPKNVRQKLHLAPGAKITVQPIDDTTALIIKEAKNPIKSARGLGAKMWQSLGGTEQYLKSERESWKK